MRWSCVASIAVAVGCLSSRRFAVGAPVFGLATAQSTPRKKIDGSEINAKYGAPPSSPRQLDDWGSMSGNAPVTQSSSTDARGAYNVREQIDLNSCV